MSFGPAFDAKEQVRQAVDIVDLVGGYMQLRRQGRNFVGLCPWHDDSRPSLQVNQERQSWKCWVCDVGGDIFSFIMKAEGLEFREALEMLAERAGVDLRVARDQGGSGASSQTGDEKRTLLKLMAWAEEEYSRCLISLPEGEPGREYLAERGIREETIRRFHVGFAPDRWDWLLNRARSTEWRPALLERVGLLRRRDTGDGHYDWFRGRVMFSIRDARSRPVAFGGRVLPQLAGDRVAKYINSPETPLFSKSRELYGLDIARDHFKSQGGAVIMEGYTDVLMAHQEGVSNAVAVLGTALGDRHLQLLRRYQVDRLSLVLDGDDAGRRRTNEILDTLLALFEKNEVDLRILTLPGGADPCDFIATHGSVVFRDLLNQAVDALEHKFLTVTNGLDTLTDTHRSSQAAEQMLASLFQLRPTSAAASSKALLREEQMLARMSRYFHLPEESLRTRLAAIRRQGRGRHLSGTSQAAQPQSVHVPRINELASWDRELLELALTDPASAVQLEREVSATEIESEVVRRVFVAICEIASDAEGFDFGRLLARFDDSATKNLLVELDEQAAAKETSDRSRRVSDLIQTRNRRRIQAEQRRELAAGRQDDDYALEALVRARADRAPEQQRIFEQKRK